MLYFVVFREEGQWVAIGLQKTVVASSQTLSGLRKNTEMTLQRYRDDDSLSFDRLPSAAPEYWEMFVEAIESGQTFDKTSEVANEAEAFALKLAA